MTFHDDPNRPRPVDDPMLDRDATGRRIDRADDAGMGWGIPLVIAAVVLIGGLFLYNASTNDRTTTASNNTPSVTTQTNPAPAPTPTPANPAPTSANPAPTSANPAPPVTTPKQ